MGRRIIALAVAALAVLAVAAPAAARDFGSVYANDLTLSRVRQQRECAGRHGDRPARDVHQLRQRGAEGRRRVRARPVGHHGGRWAVYRATWVAGDASELITSWSELQAQIGAGNIMLVRDPAADFRCPVLGSPSPIG